MNDIETIRVLAEAIGKAIYDLGIRDEKLIFEFEDGSVMRVFDNGQICCESRYMYSDDNLLDFIGATFRGAELRDGPFEEISGCDYKESQFLIITTSLGQFTVVNYNEHNGYYDGFAVVAREGR